MTEDEIYETVIIEIKERRIDQATWARALADADGDRDKTVARYIKLRVLQMNDADKANSTIIPDGVKGWSWAAFLYSPLWGVFNRVWWGLLVVIPFVGFFVALWLGFKGKEMAWSSRKWESVAHFQRVQRKWSEWVIGTILAIFGAGILVAAALPAYQNQLKRQVVVTEPAIETPGNTNAPIDWSNGKITPPANESAQASHDSDQQASQGTSASVEAEHYRQIYAAHPDTDVIIEHPSFKYWLAKYPNYQRIASKGSAQEVIDMLAAYKSANSGQKIALPTAATAPPTPSYAQENPSSSKKAMDVLYPPCVFKPVMTDEEINACRNR